MLKDDLDKPSIISLLAEACIDWPYVFGAWGEQCTPANRKKRSRSDHPTIVSKCPALSRGTSCDKCKWGIGVRMYDCRGFTHWLLSQVGINIDGQGATSQYNTSSNWAMYGEIADMPNVVCCVFQRSGNTMQHTGMHIENGVIIHCSGTVKKGKTSDRGWTHFAVPNGLYKNIPQYKTLRRGDRGEEVMKMQTLLSGKGFDVGTIDGIFGKNTLNAVKNFQKSVGLTADGICGYKTWTALDDKKDPEPVVQDKIQMYNVLCREVTWEQYMQIRKIDMNAEAEPV